MDKAKGQHDSLVPYRPRKRTFGRTVPPVSAAFLERAWSAVAEVARRTRVTVILGTERFVDGALVTSAIVIGADGSIAGFQDEVQIDPLEEGIYTPGTDRRMFQPASTYAHHKPWRRACPASRGG